MHTFVDLNDIREGKVDGILSRKLKSLRIDGYLRRFDGDGDGEPFSKTTNRRLILKKIKDNLERDYWSNY